MFAELDTDPPGESESYREAVEKRNFEALYKAVEENEISLKVYLED